MFHKCGRHSFLTKGLAALCTGSWHYPCLSRGYVDKIETLAKENVTSGRKKYKLSGHFDVFLHDLTDASFKCFLRK